LNQLSQQQAEQIADLNAENESLKTQLSDIEARLSALESQAQPQATAPNLWNVLPYLGLAALGIGFVWQVRNKRGLR
jgi:Tfp pilus assembly protein PilO